MHWGDRKLVVKMEAWHNISSEELCVHIDRCLGTKMYNDKIMEFEISGESFFVMSSKVEWEIFYQCIAMKSFQHMMKLSKWHGECKAINGIANQHAKNAALTTTTLQQVHSVPAMFSQRKYLTWEESCGNSDSQKHQSYSASESSLVIKVSPLLPFSYPMILDSVSNPFLCWLCP